MAGVVGDPHFETFDKRKYTFNGFGEFVLFEALNEKRQVEQIVQIRMRPFSTGDKARGTVISAVAIKSSSSDLIQLEKEENSQNLKVMINDAVLDLDKLAQEYIVENGANVVKKKDHILIQMTNEINLVVASDLDIQVMLYVPERFKSRTRGKKM